VCVCARLCVYTYTHARISVNNWALAVLPFAFPNPLWSIGNPWDRGLMGWAYLLMLKKCMYYLCVCIHTHERTHTYIYIHTYTHAHTYIHTYIHIYTHAYTYIYTCCVCIHIYTHTHTSTYVYTYTYVYIRVYICVCVHTHPALFRNAHEYVLAYVIKN